MSWWDRLIRNRRHRLHELEQQTPPPKTEQTQSTRGERERQRVEAQLEEALRLMASDEYEISVSLVPKGRQHES